MYMDEKRAGDMTAPLAVRLRPTSISDLLGQQHLLQPGSPLTRLIQGQERHITSVLLYGPPGSGKTTLAKMIAHSGSRAFVELSAVSSGVAQVRELLTEAQMKLTEQLRQFSSSMKCTAFPKRSRTPCFQELRIGG
jgi:putative ATPase